MNNLRFEQLGAGRIIGEPLSITEVQELVAELNERYVMVVDLCKVRDEQAATIQRLEEQEHALVSTVNGLSRRSVSLKRELATARETVERLTEALGMLYDKYENGVPCTEYGDEDGSYMGNAVKLSSEQNDQVLAALRRP